MGNMKILQLLADLKNFLSPDPSVRYYYRGLSRASYELIPRLLRPEIYPKLREIWEPRLPAPFGPVELQCILLQRFRRYASHYHLGGEHRYFAGGNPSPAEWLCVAQHHGLPTLLLDWTLNPLCALYFAVQGDHDEPGSLWYMKLKPKIDRIKLTVHLDEEYKVFNRHIPNPQNLPNQKRGPLVVVPCVFTRRIEAQAGRFIYTGEKGDIPLDKVIRGAGSLSPEEVPWEEIDFIEVPKNLKGDIRKELDACFINERTLFPDLDGCARYLSEGGV